MSKTTQRPTVMVLGTGGTLASLGEHNTSATYQSAEISVDTLVQDIPNIEQIATVKTEQIAQVNSEHMTIAIWIKLAKRLDELAQDTSIDGFVITHGTDTMEETAYFVNLVVNTNKPIVFTGAMRPANAISADGVRNLYNAIVLAASPKAAGKGALITLNDSIHQSRDVTKLNTKTLDSFRSPELGLLGYIDYSNVYFYRDTMCRHTLHSEFDIKQIKYLPQVHIIYGYVDNDACFVDAAVEHGSKGIISAGVGLGHQSKATEQALIHARKQGVIVVRCSRAKNGIIAREPDMDDRNDLVVSYMLSAQKARILLAVTLTKTNNTAEIQRIFTEY